MGNRRCRKRRYRDRIGAMLALASCLRTDGPRRHKLEKRIYLCPRCSGWHLTSTDGRP